MKILASNRREALLLFVGDALIFFISLWITLALRYLAIPGMELFETHLVPFILLFVIWSIVFFISGLYDKHTLLMKERLPSTILYAQLFNVAFAALFFFFVPYFGIAPKTNLFIYLLISFPLIVLWRLQLFPRGIRLLGGRTRQKALLLGSGSEIEELKQEINHNDRYPFEFVMHVEPQKETHWVEVQGELLAAVSRGEVTVIVGDSKSRESEALVPLLSNLAFMNVRFDFIDSTTLYENIFDRVPLSLIRASWFLEHVSTTPRFVYNVLKRLMDIIAGFLLSVVTVLLYPVVALLIKLDDGGPVLFISERVGENNQPFKLYKFRSMSHTESEKITRLGKHLRSTRLDEFPQTWNLFRGDISLIGPRPESPHLVQEYAERIPYYNIRHLTKPGISGWAQIKEYDAPRGGVVDISRTRTKLSYDLYYIKHRSLMLDVHIALKTVKALVSRSGS